VYAHYDLVLRFEHLLDVLGDGWQLGRSRVVVQLLDESPRLKARRLEEGKRQWLVTHGQGNLGSRKNNPKGEYLGCVSAVRDVKHLLVLLDLVVDVADDLLVLVDDPEEHLHSLFGWQLAQHVALEPPYHHRLLQQQIQLPDGERGNEMLVNCT
jgi:hypothetical protein